MSSFNWYILIDECYSEIMLFGKAPNSFEMGIRFVKFYVNFLI
jgi:hypothetical protein